MEKPDAPTAQSYFASGNYLWNAGIFAVRASVWIDAIGYYRKEIFAACERSSSSKLNPLALPRPGSVGGMNVGGDIVSCLHRILGPTHAI